MPDLEYTIDDGIGHIRFTRPETANALRPQTCDELIEAARRLSEHDDLGAVVVSGDGPIFCAGGDIGAFAAADHLGDFVYDMATAFHVALEYFDRLDAPTVAAVEGNVGGAGVSLVAAFDLAVVSEDAKFTMGYTGVGLTPDGSSSYYLTRAVGLKRAVDMALTNRMIDAATAEQWGLVTRLAPPGDVFEQAIQLARQLCRAETKVLGETKRLLAQGTERTLRDAMARETQAVAWAAARPETAARLHAFLDRSSSGGR